MRIVSETSRWRHQIVEADSGFHLHSIEQDNCVIQIILYL